MAAERSPVPDVVEALRRAASEIAGSARELPAEGECDPLCIGQFNSGTGATSLFITGFGADAALLVDNPPAAALYGSGDTGVIGVSASPTGAGVVASHAGTGPGIRAHSASGVAIVAEAADTAIRGTSSGTGGQPEGDVAVRGEHAGGGFGVYGLTRSEMDERGAGFTSGVLGANAGDGAGVWGSAETGPAIVGVSGSGLGGQFHGGVFVDGSLVVTGPKSAAVSHPDGTRRLLFCLESPEGWLEDFGTGEVADGWGEVRLDPGFAEVAATDTFHVFLTPLGDCGGLFVGERREDGFVVREQQGGASSVPFSYRVVARRRDTPVERLPRVSVPPRPDRLPGSPDDPDRAGSWKEVPS
jgi:hypothetical protein